ncbi:MAG: hypothetical protein IPF54_10760 [Draconibacterium sp.]|nr:hypothetical protein [Draconibacterium sp.]
MPSALRGDVNTVGRMRFRHAPGASGHAFFIRIFSWKVFRPRNESLSLRANIDHKIKKWLTIGLNSSITRTETFGMNTGTNSLSGNIFSAIRMLPNTSVFDVNDPTGYNIETTNQLKNMGVLAGFMQVQILPLNFRLNGVDTKGLKVSDWNPFLVMDKV